ncbi:MAG: hypothetical protein ACRC2T_19680 [Thermoguttaceae bacterium]
MEAIKIICISILAACFYGVAHDLVTANVCVEYFTIAHPMIFPTTSPIFLAFGWGIIATWWVGLGLGIPLACVCRFGARKKLTVKNLYRPLAVFLVILYLVAMICGGIGYTAGNLGWCYLLPPFAELIKPHLHSRFLFDIWTHIASYVFGVIGGLILICYCVYTRFFKKQTKNKIERTAEKQGTV